VARLLGQFETALAHYRDAIALRERTLGKDHPDLAADYWGIGRVHLAQKAPELALPPLERALAIREANPGSRLELGDARAAVAEALYLAHRDSSRANELLAQARADYASEGARGRAASQRLASIGKNEP
jgi:tetratricopeptide (TPR) repeat protein